MKEVSSARDFMVTNPVCAHAWEPISSVRRTMLINAFSYLPVAMHTDLHPGWHLVSDLGIAKYLHDMSNDKPRCERLAASLEQAVKANHELLIPVETCNPDEDIVSVLSNWTGFPVLVVDKTCPQKLRGLITPFDVL